MKYLETKYRDSNRTKFHFFIFAFGFMTTYKKITNFNKRLK